MIDGFSEKGYSADDLKQIAAMVEAENSNYGDSLLKCTGVPVLLLSVN